MMAGEGTLRRLLTPIQDALDHPGTTNIVIQKPGEVGVEQDGEWQWRDVPEFTYRRLDAISLLAGRMLSKDFDPSHPIVDTTLPDGHRYSAVRPPAAYPSGTMAVSIRRPMQRAVSVQGADFDDLMRDATLEEQPKHPADAELLRLYRQKDWAAFFPLSVRADKNIAAVGRPDSGKTTFLRRLLPEIPPWQRLITVQDNEEFPDITLRNRVSLMFGSAGVTPEDLIQTSLRMRPDRIAMQELRGSEAYEFLRVSSIGHTGGFTSWHAEVDDPWTPVALMVKASEKGRGIPDDKLMALLRSVIDIIAFCRRDPESRAVKVVHVYFKAAAEA